jgi:hypothetical protein
MNVERSMVKSVEGDAHFWMTSSGKSERNATRFATVARRIELGVELTVADADAAACFSIRLLKFCR